MIKAMKDFQIPMRVEVDKDTLSPTFGRFTTEAFERGFGTTVGNSLRRVLLSSLTGAAVTTVKIEGVLHEFSTIPGVTEDVCSPIVEKLSGKQRGIGFQLGYSPERINPGDKVHRLETIIKIVAAQWSYGPKSVSTNNTAVA